MFANCKTFLGGNEPLNFPSFNFEVTNADEARKSSPKMQTTRRMGNKKKCQRKNPIHHKTALFVLVSRFQYGSFTTDYSKLKTQTTFDSKISTNLQKLDSV